MNIEVIFSYFISHKEWIFSGIGVLILTVLYTSIKQMDYSKITQNILKLKSLIISFFTSSERVAKSLNIDLRPRRTAFEFWLQPPSYVNLWFRTTNFNSFDLILKQITVEIVFAGVHLKLNEFFHDQVIPSKAIFDLVHINVNISDEQASYIAKYKGDDHRCRISIKATLKTPSREVVYENRYIEDVNYILINQSTRL